MNRKNEDTGRLKKGLIPEVSNIIFGTNVNEAIESELLVSVIVDKAHIIMLKEKKIIKASHASKLLKAIVDLEKTGFKALKGRKAKRGWYLLYEGYLINKLGEKIGGSVHTGRSRNDLHATVFRLKVRNEYIKCIKELLDLRKTLLQAALKHKKAVMPLHTQMQPALPSTLTHYLLAIDSMLDKDIDTFIESFNEVMISPLGSGAGGGTTFPIDSERTADLLGFSSANDNSIESVASYNYVLRLLSSMSVLSVTLNRFASDFHLWMTKEFGFIRLPETLMGSSSMMPQKANPFIMEHVKGKTSLLAGSFMSALTAMHKVPVSNAIEVKKEGAPEIWKAFKIINEVSVILKHVLENFIVEKNLMRKNSEYSFTAATAVAELLVKETGCSFRSAHKQIGIIVSSALENNVSFKDAVVEHLGKRIDRSELESIFNFRTLADRFSYGSGPGAIDPGIRVTKAKDKLKKQNERISNLEKGFNRADARLERTVDKIIKNR